MSQDPEQIANGAQHQADAGEEASPVATVAGGILSAFFDELEKADGLAEKASKLRGLVLGDGVMAEPAMDVRRRDGRLHVSVRRGRVAVVPTDGRLGPKLELVSGGELDHVEGTQTFQVTQTPAQR